MLILPLSFQENTMSETSSDRRKFLFTCTVAAAAPLLARSVHAQTKQKVDPASPQAKAVNYVEDAKQSKDPKRKPDQFCHSCQLFQADAKEKLGPCAIFGGNLVANQGWCSAWVKKA
jgi:hypothetical protein